jgi:ABC-type phosphate transport system substrate-binding protein
MKKVVFLLAVALLTTSAFAQNSAQDVIYIKSVKFATPLLEKWIAEYSKVNPEIKIAVADKTANAEDIDIQLIASNEDANQQSVSIGRYAVLPITGKSNALLSELQKKKLNAKRIKELFFEKDLLDDDYEEAKDKYNATIYSVVNASSVANTFAGHFGFEPSKLKGKKISGDEIYLINAIQKDNTGVSFNNLSYVFDITSRKLKTNIALLPLDLKKEYSEVIAEANLDKVIDLLETKSIDLIPVEDINFVATHTPDAQTEQFLQWIITDGQAYNHQFGFLNAEKNQLSYKK